MAPESEIRGLSVRDREGLGTHQNAGIAPTFTQLGGRPSVVSRASSSALAA
jgi:hypothetical protein